MKLKCLFNFQVLQDGISTLSVSGMGKKKLQVTHKCIICLKSKTGVLKTNTLH